MSKHTSGPWVVCEANGAVDVDQSDKMGAAPVAHMAVGGLGPNIEEMRANARLIAAAPEMLAALREVVESFADEIRDNPRYNNIGRHDSLRRLDRYWDLISKAQGHTPADGYMCPECCVIGGHDDDCEFRKAPKESA